MKPILFLLTTLSVCTLCATGQQNPLPLNIQKAYAKGTRSADGNPGVNYWQNSADYVIRAEVDTAADRLTGSLTVNYHNNSPDSLTFLIIRLYQDIFRKGGSRQWPIPEKDVTDGIKITRLVIGDTVYSPESDFPRWWMTNFWIRLKEKIGPGSETKIEIDWHFDIPAEEGLRMCKYGPGHYFIAYWYPQIAVYDDVDGWDRIEYQGMVEFYNDFNNYRVDITVPGNFVVWATGELQNAGDVLRPEIIERLNSAKTSDSVIRIVTPDDLKKEKVTARGKFHTWTFLAEKVPDFSFAMSNSALWDGASLVPDRESGRRLFTDAVYPEGSSHWSKAAEMSRESIQYMSEEMPGIPFPYPQMTSFCSGSGGGMETPMMANDGAPRKYAEFVELLFHEISHTYLPFYMGTNERKYAWMDEGWATFFPIGFMKGADPESDYLKATVRSYVYMAGQETEMPPMIPSFQNNNYSSAYTAFYLRPAMAYLFLRDALGDDMFKKALRVYMERWHGLHPLPYDFFNTFEDVTGEDLDWFWQPWFFGSGYPDLAIREVTAGNVVVVEKLGTHPVPVSLYYQTAEGGSEKVYHSTAVWKDGKKEFKVQLPRDLNIVKVELGNDHIPDVISDNNSWTRQE